MLEQRIRRLEAWYRRQSPKPQATESVAPLTVPQRVQAVRNIIATVAARTDSPIEDPWAGWEGEAYLVVSWPWLVHLMHSWPDWAQEAAASIGGGYLLPSGLIDKEGQFTRKGLKAWNAEVAKGEPSALAVELANSPII